MRRVAAAAVSILLLALSAARAGESVKIPRPTDRLAPPPPAPAVEPSGMSMPVTVSVDTLGGAVAKGFPAERGEEEKWLEGGELVGTPGFQYQYRLWRGTPQLRAAGDRLEVSFPDMKYRVRGRLALAQGPVGGSCGYDDPPRRLHLAATTQLTWAPDGTLRARTAFSPADFVDPCKLSPVDVDATPVLKKALEAKLPEMARALDAAIRAQSLSRRRLAALWQRLQTPIELASGLWLTLSPAALGVSPFSSEGEKTLKTSLWLAISPRAVTGEKPAAKQAPLPRVQVEAARGAGCHIAMPIKISYGQMNARLQKEVVGTEFEAGPLGTIKVISTHLYGSGDRLVMEVGVSGGVNGKIYAIGKPAIDSAALMLKIEDLDLTIETKNLFAKAANTMAKDKLIASLEPATRVELKDRIEGARRNLERRLQREIIPGVRMEASDVRITPHGVYPAPGGIEVQAVVDAALRLAVR
ncbi:MAG: DUF4403 family protein [Thermoanaerobaculia bacterium]